MRRRLADASLVLLVPLALLGAVCAVGVGILGYRLISTSGAVPRLTSAMLGNGEDPNAATCTTVTPYAAATGTFVVTGNAFQQVSDYAIPDADTQITSLTVEAWVNTASVSITSVSRSFAVAFSGASVGSWSQSLSGLQAPWNTNSGSTHRSLAWNVADTGYSAVGAGRVRVSGSGTRPTWSANPDQRIYVIVHLAGTARSSAPCP